jgi:hypothetical protein
MTLKDYPPSQTPASFNLAKVQKEIEASRSAEKGEGQLRGEPVSK